MTVPTIVTPGGYMAKLSEEVNVKMIVRKNTSKNMLNIFKNLPDDILLEICNVDNNISED